jgi:23S rRNA (cytosine1962-C5)-methyltransferase
MIPCLQLKPIRNSTPRVLKGHPWVFASEVVSYIPQSFAGQGVGLRDIEGRWMGMGIYNPKSQIIWRRYTWDRDALFDGAFFQKALEKALAKRGPVSVGRLVWSEVDGLPGLVVDRYQDVLVIQALTLAVERNLEVFTDILKQLLPEITEVVYRCDAPSRQYEGLNMYARTASGNPLAPKWYDIDGVDYWLDLEHGHKTGFYLDQREQHVKVGAMAKGKKVIDAFCNQGSFALQAARHGAESVFAIDISEACIQSAEKNAERAGFNQVKFRASNMFDILAVTPANAYDLIVLDPPSFARNKEALQGALRGYKELNLRALKALRPGGVLATYACSHAVTMEIFHETVCDAALDTHREVQVLEVTGQPLDHPISLLFPESAYIKGLILRVE